jgi:hypothetical protein
LSNITAIHHSEERYASLTLVAHTKEDIENAKAVVQKVIDGVDGDIRICESEVEDNYEVTVEFHDDYDKKSGDYFDRIIKELNIEICE